MLGGLCRNLDVQDYLEATAGDKERCGVLCPDVLSKT